MLGNSLAKFFKIDDLVNNLTGYVETKVEIVKLEVKRDVNQGVSEAIAYLLIGFVFALVLFFVSLGVAILLSDVLGSIWGYLIVAAFYAIIGAVMYAKRQDLIQGFKQRLSSKK